MGPINTLPLGFLDLLGLQQQGRNLAEVAEAVAGVIELTPYYGCYKRAFIIGDLPFAAAATDTQVVATVPANEYWFIFGGVAQCASLAGATGRAGVQLVTQGRAVGASSYQSVAFAAQGEGLPINFGWTVPPILAPGDAIWKAGYGLAGAGNERLNVRISYMPLRG